MGAGVAENRDPALLRAVAASDAEKPSAPVIAAEDYTPCPEALKKNLLNLHTFNGQERNHQWQCDATLLSMPKCDDTMVGDEESADQQGHASEENESKQRQRLYSALTEAPSESDGFEGVNVLPVPLGEAEPAVPTLRDPAKLEFADSTVNATDLATPSHASCIRERLVGDTAVSSACQDEIKVMSEFTKNALIQSGDSLILKEADEVSARLLQGVAHMQELAGLKSVANDEQPYELGRRVIYWSDTHKQWMPAVVTKVHLDRNGVLRCYDLDVKSGARPDKIKPHLSQRNVVSPKQKPNAVEVEVAHAELVPGTETQICAPADEKDVPSCEPTCNSTNEDSGFMAGDRVEYWSLTYDSWMQAVLECVRDDGLYDLDIKRGASLQKIRRISLAQAASISDKVANTSGPTAAGLGVQVGCAGPTRQAQVGGNTSTRRSPNPEGNAQQSNGADRSVSQGLVLAPSPPVNMHLADPVPAALPVGVENASSWRSTSPISGRVNAPAQYAHRLVSSSTQVEQVAYQRSSSPISGRRCGYSLEQPPLLDVTSTEAGAAGVSSFRKSEPLQAQGVSLPGIQANLSHASPVMRSRSVMGGAETAGASALGAQPLKLGLAPVRGVVGADTLNVQSMLKHRDTEKHIVVRQTSCAGGAPPERAASHQPPIVSSNVYMTRTYATGSTAGTSGSYFVNAIPPAASANIRARSSSTGRNSLVPDRIQQEGTATPTLCAMQVHGSARQISSVWAATPAEFTRQISPGVQTSGEFTRQISPGVQTSGVFPGNGGHCQLEVEDLAVGEGQFDPSQPSVRAQLMTKLRLPGDVQVEAMIGFTGGLNDGVWFLNSGAGRSLVLKLVRGQRQHESIPTEAEACLKLSQEFPGIGNDVSISFPTKILRCVRPDASKLHDLIVMIKAPGMRLAEVTAHKFHNKEVDSIRSIYERVGRLLFDFHLRFRHYQHGDLQPSNVMFDEETGKITLIDVGGMGLSRRDSDVSHFRASMDILARSYGLDFVAKCLQHFQSGYESAMPTLSNR